MAKPKATKSPVTTRALVQRLNRKLAGEGEQLIKARGANAAQELGEYYTVNTHTGNVESQHVDLDVLARRLGVLKAWEVVQD